MSHDRSMTPSPSVTVDSLTVSKTAFAFQIPDNRSQFPKTLFFCVTSVTVDSFGKWIFFGGVASQEIFGGNL